MKVYTLRATNIPQASSYRPILGFYRSKADAIAAGKAMKKETPSWEVSQWEFPDRLGIEQIVELLNGDSLSSLLDGLVMRDFLVFNQIVHKSPAFKRLEQEGK